MTANKVETFSKNILHPLLNSIKTYKERNAFFIDNAFYTYNDLAKCISKIRKSVKEIPENNVGLVANDDLETYASILALWLEGKCYVPLHPGQPIERCLDIISQVNMHYILDSSDETRYKNLRTIMTKRLFFETYDLKYETKYSDERLAYIIFTSGSTGKPKGVPLSRGNIAAFIKAFFERGYKLDENDRCLQMFDLTFDMSVQSYLTPLLVGACAYTVAYDSVKYMNIFELIDEQKLTFTVMVPSIIHYMLPYMDEIYAPDIRYSLFAGESLTEDDAKIWSHSIPNARIDNLYGPTEATIYCTGYTFKRDIKNKETNGVLSIGKPYNNIIQMIINGNKEEVPKGTLGELCFAGPQLTPGYWNNPEKNAEAFFIKDGVRFYRTGDLCTMDKDGDILYHGRIDFQVKIQGYRIELGEIEHNARIALNGVGAIAVAIKDAGGNYTLALCIEQQETDTNKLLKYLKSKLPAYMIPSKFCCVPQFPLNSNGKIDRKQLAAICLRQ